MFKQIHSSPRNPRANGKIENIHNFLKCTMKKIIHSNPKMQWHEAIQIAAHNYNYAAEITKNRSKDDNKKITKDPPLKLYDRVLVQNHHNHGLEPKFHSDWRVVDFNSDRQVVVPNNAGDCRIMSTRHVKKATFYDTVFSTLNLFKPTWKT